MADRDHDSNTINKVKGTPSNFAVPKYLGPETNKLLTDWFWTGSKTNYHLIKAYSYIKQAFAETLSQSKNLDNRISMAISQACEEIRSKDNSRYFIAEPIQSISGTTINTNINEVLANRAEEILGGKSGEYKLVQPEMINTGQDAAGLFLLSTKIAVLKLLAELEPELLNLERLLRRDVLTLAKVLKVSAMPNIQSTTGQWGKRLDLFTTELEIAIRRIKEAENNLSCGQEIALAAKDMSQNQLTKAVLKNLERLSGLCFKETDLCFGGGKEEFVISDLGLVSSTLKDLAMVLGKVAGVIKLAHTPSAADATHSIKNDEQLLADSLHMIAYQVIANNFAFTFLAQCEQSDSIMLAPLLSHNLLSSIDLLQVIVIGFQRKGLI